MATKKAKRPRSAKRRTLPPDPISLIIMIRATHRRLCDRAEHVKHTPHDLHARRGFQSFHDQRSQAWMALYAQSPEAALALAAELNVKLPSSISSSTPLSQGASS